MSYEDRAEALELAHMDYNDALRRIRAAGWSYFKALKKFEDTANDLVRYLAEDVSDEVEDEREYRRISEWEDHWLASIDRLISPRTFEVEGLMNELPKTRGLRIPGSPRVGEEP